MFEHGPVEMAYYVMDAANRAAVEAMQSADLASMDVNERIVLGMSARINAMAPYLPVWHSAMALGLRPQHVTQTAKLLATWTDELWYQAGDRSVDNTWYSRR